MTARGRFVFDADTAQANASLNRTNKAALGVGDSFMKSLGPLAKMATAAGAIAAVSGVVLKVWTEITEQMDAAAGRITSAAQARARLLSLAPDTAGVQRLSGAVSDTQRETGINESEAANFQFQLESLGLGENRKDLAQVFNLGQDATAVATAVSRIRKVFGEEAGAVNDLVNKLFAGAQTSEVGIDEFGETIARVGSIIQATGTPLDDLIATFSQLGGKEIRELATNVKALGTAAVKSGETGGIIKFVEKLGGQDLNNKQLQKKLGSVEAFEAFRLIQGQLGNLPGARSSISDAVENNVVGQRLGLVDADGRVGAAQRLAQQQARTTLQQDAVYGERGAQNQQFKSTRDQLRAQREAQGDRGFFDRLTEAIFTPVADFITPDSYIPQRLANVQEQLLLESTRTADNTRKQPPRAKPESQAHPELPQGSGQ